MSDQVVESSAPAGVPVAISVASARSRSSLSVSRTAATLAGEIFTSGETRRRMPYAAGQRQRRHGRDEKWSPGGIFRPARNSRVRATRRPSACNSVAGSVPRPLRRGVRRRLPRAPSPVPRQPFRPTTWNARGSAVVRRETSRHAATGGDRVSGCESRRPPGTIPPVRLPSSVDGRSWPGCRPAEPPRLGPLPFGRASARAGRRQRCEVALDFVTGVVRTHRALDSGKHRSGIERAYDPHDRDTRRNLASHHCPMHGCCSAIPGQQGRMDVDHAQPRDIRHMRGSCVGCGGRCQQPKQAGTAQLGP